MRTTTRVTAALVSSLIAVGATAASAQADTTTLRDKASDVLTFTDQTTDQRGTQLGYSQSKESGLDLRSLRVKHTTRSVAINLGFSRLSPDTVVTVSLRLDGKATPTRFLVSVGDGKARVTTPKGSSQCTVPLSVRLGDRGHVNAVIKRSCLGDPDRIKASALVSDEGLYGDNTPYTADAVSPSSVRGVTWTTWLSPS